MSKDVVTPAELAALTTTAGGKYNARRTYVPELERWFASKHEAGCAVVLWRRQQAGEIRDLRFQVAYDLVVGAVKVTRYVADFVYRERIEGGWWMTRVADAKGFRTPVYKLKAKLMLALRGIEIVEL